MGQFSLLRLFCVPVGIISAKQAKICSLWAPNDCKGFAFNFTKCSHMAIFISAKAVKEMGFSYRACRTTAWALHSIRTAQLIPA